MVIQLFPKRRAVSRVFTLISSFVWLASAGLVTAQTTTWNAAIGANWSPGTWTNGLPDSSTDAFIRRTSLTAVTVQNGLNAQALNVFIGSNGGAGSNNGRVTIASGGNLETFGLTGVTVGHQGHTGVLNINGTLITRKIQEGTGSGSINFNGGTLIAKEDGVDLISGFENGDVQIANGGATIDTAGFSLSISSQLSNTLLNLGSLRVIGGGNLTLSNSNNTYAGGTTISDASRVIVSSNANLGNTLIIQSFLTFDDGTLEVTSNIPGMNRFTTLNSGGGTYQINDGVTLAQAGIHSGAGALTKRGNGTLVLTGINLFSGGTIIEAGVLQLGNGGLTGSLGSGAILNNATLTINRSNPLLLPFLLSNTISGTGVVRHIGSGVTFLQGNNTYSGGTEITNGTLFAENSNSLGTGNVTMTGGRLSYNDEVNLSNQISLDGNAELSVFIAGWEAEQSGVISGAADLTKVEDGLLSLTSNNTHTGTTFINRGTLQIGKGGTTGSIVSNVEVGTNGILAFNRSNDLDLTGIDIKGSGVISQVGSGSTFLGATPNFSGEVILKNGVLAPMETLTAKAFTWNDGDIQMDLDGNSLINLTNNFSKGGPGAGGFLISSGTEGQTYKLVNFTSTNFVVSDFAAQWATPNVVLNGIFNLTPTFLEFKVLTAQATGAILQNSNPVNIPTFADFTVNGTASTGEPNESNTINSLLFLPSSSLQVFNNLTVNSGKFNVAGGIASLFGGNVITPGDFNKFGAGNLISNTNFQVGGAANIQGGGLIVNGQLTAPGGLTVFQNALLGGSGIINANVFNNGTTAPGNSPGTLTINGNFSQSSSGTLQIEIASPTVFDRLIVSGAANLAGTLQVLNLGKNLKYGQQYAFLQAGSINGEFDQILMPNPSRFRGRFLTNGGLGRLLVAPTSYTLVAETPNQRRVAKALDSYIPARGNDRETVSIALDLQTEDQYPAAFDAIAPTFHESIANISIEQAFAQTQLLNQRMSSVRLGSRAFQAIGMDAEPLVHDKDGKSVADPKDFKSQISNFQSPAWAIWAQGNGMFAKVTNVSQVPNYRFNSGGFLFGADYTFGGSDHSKSNSRNSKLSTGVFAGYQGTYADYNSAGRTSINSALFGGYASYSQGGFYADTVIAGGYNNYNVRRSIEFSTIDRSARSSQNGGQFSAAFNLGYDWEIGKFTLGPIAGLQYTYVGIAPFTESGADSLNLRVGQQNANSMRSTLGGRIAYTWTVSESLVIIPEVRMFWLHEFLNNPRVIGSALDGGSGESFGYLTSTPDRDSVFAGAGFSAQLGPNWFASAFWNIDFGRQDFLNHIISANLGMKF